MMRKNLFDKALENFVLTPDKYVFAYEIHEKAKVRRIITYNDVKGFGISLRSAHEDIRKRFEENFFERNPHSYAYHPGVRALDAFKDHLNSTHFIKLDIHHFFESITEEAFFSIYGDSFNSNWKAKLKGCFYRGSLSIGFVTSPLLSNFYMSRFDKALEEYLSDKPELHYSRYSDDILLSSEQEGEEDLLSLLVFVKEELGKLGLVVNEKKTQKISLDLEKKNSISFLGLSLSKKDEGSCKITVSKRYILFLLSLIKKNEEHYQNRCPGLIDEINSRVAYLYYSSEYSYARFQKKHFNLFGKYYDFVPKKQVSRVASNSASAIADWAQYQSEFKFDLHGKIVNKSNGRYAVFNGVIITEYLGQEEEVTIPYFVDGLAENCFKNRKIKKVILPDRLKAIGDDCFKGCSSLKEINLPSSLIYLGCFAFSDTGIEKIAIPSKLKTINARCFYQSGLKEVSLANVEKIDEGAFECCFLLKKISLPESVREIGAKAFAYCYSLEEAALPSSLQALPSSCFEGDHELSSVSLPSSLFSLNENCFADTGLNRIYIPENVIKLESALPHSSSLKEIEVDPNNKVYYSKDNFIIERDTNRLVYALSYVSYIPEEVKIIGNRAFKGSLIQKIVIPKNVALIEASAFESCILLKEVEFETERLGKICSSAFRDCLSLISLSLPDSLVEIGPSAFAHCPSLKEVNWGEGLNKICVSAFEGDSSLENIILPSKVRRIGPKAFAGCSKVKKLFLPNATENIGIFAFSHVSKSLESIEVGKENRFFDGAGNCLVAKKRRELILGCKNSVIPSSVSSISKGAFRASAIEEFNAPMGLQKIGEEAFCGCSNLKKAVLPGVFEIKARAFEGCSSLSEIELPSSLSNLGERAFCGCSSLKGISLPDSLSNIGSSCFRNCLSLSSIVFPSSLHRFVSTWFMNCPSLEKISMRENNAFYRTESDCLIRIGKEKDSIILGGNKAKIPEDKRVVLIHSLAFAWRQGIEEIDLPKNIISLGSCSFAYSSIERFRVGASDTPRKFKLSVGVFACSSLKSLDLREINSETDIPASLCYGCANLTEVLLPNDTTSIGDNAFAGCFSLNHIDLPSFLSSIGKASFKDTSLSKIAFPSRLCSIDDFAFNGTKLEEICIPPCCLNLSPSAFDKNKLAKIEVDSPSFSHPGNYLRSDGTNSVIRHTEGYDHEGKTKASETLIVGCANSTFDSAVTRIGPKAFEGVHISKIALPEGITSIGERAFASSDLEEVTLPSSLNSLGREAFSCTRIKKMVLPEKLIGFDGSALPSCLEELVSKRPGDVKINGSLFDKNKRLLWRHPLDLGSALLSEKDFKFSSLTMDELVLPEGALCRFVFVGCKIKKLVLAHDSFLSLAPDNSIETISIPNGSDFYTYDNGVLFNRFTKKAIYIASEGTILSSINEFVGMSSLRSVLEIPATFKNVSLLPPSLSCPIEINPSNPYLIGNESKNAIIRKSDRALLYAGESYSYDLEGVEMLDLSLLKGKKPGKSLKVPATLLYLRLARNSDFERIYVDPRNPNYVSLPEGRGYRIKRVSISVPGSMKRRPYSGMKTGKLWIDDAAAEMSKATPCSRPRPFMCEGQAKPIGGEGSSSANAIEDDMAF